MAEVLAAAFRANTTGTIALEQGAGESRLFVRYGTPCGALLYGETYALSEALLDAGVVDKATIERTLAIAATSGRKHGEVLVEQGALGRDELRHFVRQQQQASLFRLCIQREGRYELRGWERPPEWTEGLDLDPLRILLDALRSDELADRRAAILEVLEPHRIRHSPDTSDLARRLALEPLERRAVATAGVPRSTSDFGGGMLEPEEARTFLCAAVLLNLLEIDDGSRAAPRTSDPEPVLAGDALADLLRPIPEPPRPASRPAPVRTTTGPISTTTGPISTTTGPISTRNPSPRGDELERAIARNMTPEPLPRVPPARPAAIELDLELGSDNGVEFAPGEFALEVNPDEEPLELDFDRAPRQMRSSHLEEGLRPPPRAPRPAPRPAEAPRDTPKPTSEAPKLRKPKAPEYNPFAPRPPVAPATDSTSAPGAPAPAATGRDILAGIEDLVGHLPEERTGPIALAERATPPPSDDDLALLAAQETSDAHETIEAEPLDHVEVSPHPERSPAPLREKREVSPRPENADVRRRLLARAFRNVGGEAFQQHSTTSPHATTPTVAAPEAPAPRPEKSDFELEREVIDRLSRRNEDHFQRLDVERTATTEQVKEAFLQLAKRFHPDRLSAMGQPHLLPQVRELFSRIKESYDELVDPASRARHLSTLEAKDNNGKVTHDPQGAKVAFQKAAGALRKHDLVAAEAELVRAVALDPLPVHMAELAWTLYANPKRRDDARDEIRDLVVKALKGTPEHDRAYVVAAYISRVDGEAERSEKLFRKALDLNPRNVEAARELRLIESRRPPSDAGGGLFSRLRRK